MFAMRGLVGLYIAGVSALALTGLFAVGVGDHEGPHEGLLQLLVVVSVGAALAAVALASRRIAIAGTAFLAQVASLVAASLVDRGNGGIRVAPPVTALGIAVEVIGAIAVARAATK